MNQQQAATTLLAEDARELAMLHEPVDVADVLAGAPTTASEPLCIANGVEVGIWEITSGVVTDIEADEVFVVLSGRGRVDVQDGTSIRLNAGSVVRLTAGSRTRWFIYETLRKVYVLLPASIPAPDPA